MKTDFLVIGSGAAGLSFALKAAAHGHVTIVTKGAIEECNTNYAQGGICSVTYAPDTFEKHIRDTLVCGAGKCDEKAVELVVRRAPELIADLIAWGTRFDKTPDGRFELNREGGHSEHRILHHEDLTGAEIERALVQSVREHPNITVLERHFAIDLLTQHHLGEFVTRHTRGLASFGAYVLNLDTNEIETLLSKFTVVATGGCGNVYSTTSNPVVATGDGIAMCHRAKAMTENMEFIQFHPTTLYNPGEKPNFLITEAMRGFGAILRLPDGKEFMDKYHPMKSLAPRDVVARAIYREMTKRGSDFVYLDVTHKNPEAVKSHFPNIYEKCRSIGIDSTKDWITSDDSKRKEYEADPLCNFVFTVNGYYQMFEGMKVLTRRHAMDKIPVELPVIFVSGAEDPVGSNGVGVTRVFRKYEVHGMTDVEMKLYAGDRHEILNETDREEVYEDLYRWMEKRI